MVERMDNEWINERANEQSLSNQKVKNLIINLNWTIMLKRPFSYKKWQILHPRLNALIVDRFC